MLSHYGYKTPEPDPAANIQYDVWEKNILSLAGNKDYEKVVRVHQEILKRSLNMDPLSKAISIRFPCICHIWKPFWNLMQRPIAGKISLKSPRLFNRRMEIKDDPMGEGRFIILPYLTRFLKIYLSAQNKKFYFKNPIRRCLSRIVALRG